MESGEHLTTLAELDLEAVLGFSITPSVAAALHELDTRLDALERGPLRNGWSVGRGERHIAAKQSRSWMLGRALSYPAARDDSYELTVDVWQHDATTLLIDAAVEVYCFCPVNHNIDRPVEQEWRARSDVEVGDALTAAVTALEGWVALGLDADQWRARATLPDRSSPRRV